MRDMRNTACRHVLHPQWPDAIVAEGPRMRKPREQEERIDVLDFGCLRDLCGARGLYGKLALTP